MRRILLFTVAFLMIFSTAACLTAAEVAEEDTPLQGLDKIEDIVYGSPGSGGLLLRLSKVERDLFGMELPGSLTERQQALDIFVEKGSAGQPSLLFKTNVAEWVTNNRAHSALPLKERIEALERTLEGSIMEGALSARLERLITKLLPGGVMGTNVMVASGTVFKAKFVHELTVRNVKKGDVVELELDEDCISGGTLAAAKGNRIFACVTKVKLPRSFGRPSEITVEFENVEFLDGKLTHVFIGPEAKKAMEVDQATIGALGTSFLGAILVGPVGLAGGFLVRGSDKTIPEGTLAYVETADAIEVSGYMLPGSVLDNIVEGESAPPQQDTDLTNSYSN